MHYIQVLREEEVEGHKEEEEEEVVPGMGEVVQMLVQLDSKAYVED